MSAFSDPIPLADILYAASGTLPPIDNDVLLPALAEVPDRLTDNRSIQQTIMKMK
jgi:hypothetical protein